MTRGVVVEVEVEVEVVAVGDVLTRSSIFNVVAVCAGSALQHLHTPACNTTAN